MNKREFYIAALKAETYRITAFNIACFGLIREGAEEWQNNPYPYRIVQLPNAYHYVNPENTSELLKIDDGVVGKPLFGRNELLALNVGDMENVQAVTTTTYGNALVNQLLLVQAFGKKIGFITGRFSTKHVEAIIEARLMKKSADYNAEDLARDEANPETAPIYIDEYIRFADGAFSLVAYTQLFTPADTRKTMTRPPGITAIRDKLLEENKGRLHDRAVVGQIAAELQKVDAEYLKGDRGLDFLTSKKSKEIVRSRLFLMYGAETGIEDKVDVDLISNSLTEGWDVTKMPTMNNALRAGSFNRGKLTELGGEAVKDLFRASGNLRITEDDCGDTVGIPEIYTEETAYQLIGFSVVVGSSSVRVTKETVGQYLNKPLRKRTSMSCKLPHTDLCKVCVGERLANNSTGLSMAVADYGSTFMAISMSGAHSKGIQLINLDLEDVLL